MTETRLNSKLDKFKKPKTIVGLVQINNSFSGQNYLPYSVGILQAYAEKFLENRDQVVFQLPVYLRESVSTSVAKLDGADIIFFSAYVWNIRISLEIARQIKLAKPNTAIVFGGPQVPDRVEAFLKKYSFIDVACHGEGERVFTSILESGVNAILTRDLSNINSISFVDQKGRVMTNPQGARIETLDDIPSPYLSGVFDSLMETNPEEKWIVLWETNRGCPFECAFCDWGSATQARVYRFGMERLHSEMDWFAKQKIEFIFCADANFGMFDRDYDVVKYAAESKNKVGYPHAFSVQNTKNSTEKAFRVQKLLADSGLNKGVSISLQSVDPETLEKIKRKNISTKSFEELQRRFTRDGVETYSDLILGMPGETYESFTKGVAIVIAHGQHNRIQFNNLSILPNAAMGDPEYQKEHGMIIVESEVVNIHGSLELSHNEILETQELVVGTKASPKEDWVRVRAFSWAAAFYYFNKILQIPLLLLHSNYSARFDDLIKLFIDDNLDDLPTLKSVRTLFFEKAQDIQNGGAEYCSSPEWLNIWWPADELVLIHLCTESKLDSFYKEAETLIGRFLKRNNIDLPRDLLHQAMHLNRSLIKLPFQKEDLTLELSYNLWETYQAALLSQHIPIEEKASKYFIDRTSHKWESWEKWCQEVVWWGNKKGAYLYLNAPVDPQMSGHF